MKNDKLSFINKDIISLILSVFFSLTIFFLNDSKYVKAVEEDIIDFVSTISYPKTWYNDILYIKENNKLLKQKIVQLELLNSKFDNYRIENQKLRNMLVFKEGYNKLSLIPSNIVNHNFLSSVYSLIIDIGDQDGIVKNQPVIDMKGLLGKTINVGNKASKIQMITDKNFAVSVKVGKDMMIAIFKPIHGKYGILEGVIKSSKINIGEIVYTSGISEIYPSDIPVAKVIDIKREKDKPFQDVRVEILADIRNLNYVFVIQ